MPIRRVALVLLLVVGACSGGGSDDAAPATTASVTSTEKDRGTKSDGEDGEDGEAGAGGKKACPAPDGDRELDAVASEVLIEGSGSEPEVRAAVYPHPPYEGRPWSQWGQGVVVGDTFLSAIGDHCGANGDSYLFAYDTGSHELEPLGDVLSIVGHTDGAWGYGKVHAAMVEGPDGDVYATTYWGSHDGIAFTDGYEGDRLLRIDPASGEVSDLGAPLPGLGIPSLAGSAEHGLLYGEATVPNADPRESTFFVYDLDAGEVVFTADKGPTKGVRSILVDADGRAWYSTADGRLDVYDPDTGEASRADVELPGRTLRAASAPAPDGTVYGVTLDPEVLFSLSPDGELTELGPVRGYTASLALSPDGSTLYYVPDAHGGSHEQGTPVIAVDTSTGDERVLVELNDAAEDALDLRLGGSYDVVADPDGTRLLIGLNAGPVGSDDTFGEIVLVEVLLP